MAKAEVKLISCRGCGTIMVKLSRDVCQKCYLEEEELFLKVRDYIRSNPSESIPEIALGLNTPEEKIQYFVDTGRLERTGVNVMHTCQTCHTIIKTGLICQECSDLLKSQVGDLRKSIAVQKELNDKLWKKDQGPAKGDHKGKPK